MHRRHSRFSLSRSLFHFTVTIDLAAYVCTYVLGDGSGAPTVFVAVAGLSNGLGPVSAGYTAFPVINCPPVDLSNPLVGLDLWSSLRLPSGSGLSFHLNALNIVTFCTTALCSFDDKNRLHCGSHFSVFIVLKVFIRPEFLVTYCNTCRSKDSNFTFCTLFMITYKSNF